MITAAGRLRSPVSTGRRRWLLRFPGRVGLFAAVTTGLLGLWLLLALLYGGLGAGRSVVDTMQLTAALSSSNGRSGDLETSAILATPAYFRATDRSPRSLGVNPERNVVVLAALDTHIGELPDPSVWTRAALLEVDRVPVAPLPGYRIAFRSNHHQTVALQFPRTDEKGRALVGSAAGTLRLSVPGIEPGDRPASMTWTLPLTLPEGARPGSPLGAAASLGGVLAVMAGLLVVFSPCAVHMTAYFLPLVTGLGMKEVLARTHDRRFRAHVALLGLAFVSGFIALYTTFGVAAGFAGRFFADTSRLAPFLVPVRLLTGAVVIYMALQTLGVFRLPFVVSLRLPGRPHEARRRQAYIAAMLAGMSVSAGCLACVGGTLLASLLLYAGASGSPLVGGATLFLFAAGMSLPFLLAALAFDKVVPRFIAARAVLRHSATVAGAVMLVVGLIILSGNESVFERLVA